MVQPFSELELAFMREKAIADIPGLLLKGKWSVREKYLLEQVARRQRVAKKLPLCVSNEQFQWPPTLHLEQSSSEKTAQFKANLLEGGRLIDLSAGLGIDALYMAPRVERIDLVEPNTELSAWSAYNLNNVMGIKHAIFHGGKTAETFLEDDKTDADWIYVDPSRRGIGGQKVFKLDECSPNITALLPRLLTKAPRILVKLSPMADVRQLQRELPCIHTVWALYTDGECKELLLLLTAGEHELTMIAVDLDNGISVSESAQNVSTFNMPYHLPMRFIYEPNAAIHKLALYRGVAKQYGVEKLHPDSHLFTSDDYIPDFPGRTFECISICSLDRTAIKEAIPDNKAHISVRNFPLTVAQIRTKSKLADGGSAYVFATTLIDRRKVLLVCKKASN